MRSASTPASSTVRASSGPRSAASLIAAAGAGVCFAVNAVELPRRARRTADDAAGGVPLGRAPCAPAHGRSPGSRKGSPTRGATSRSGCCSTWCSSMSTFCLNFNVLLPVLAKQTLHSGPQVFGLLSAVFGVGALIGALVSAHVSRATVGHTARRQRGVRALRAADRAAAVHDGDRGAALPWRASASRPGRPTRTRSSSSPRPITSAAD